MGAIHKIRIINVRSIRDMEVGLDGQSVVHVIGPNGAGKTTLVDCAMFLALGKPVPPVTAGQEMGEVSGTIGEFSVRRKIKDGKQALVVKRSDGSTIASPQAALNALVGNALDLTSVMEMADNKKLEYLIPIESQGELEQLRAQAKANYQKRADARAAAKAHQKVADATVIPVAPDLERVAAAKAACANAEKMRQAAEAANRDRWKLEKDVDAARLRKDDLDRRMAEALRHMEELEDQVMAVDQELVEKAAELAQMPPAVVVSSDEALRQELVDLESKVRVAAEARERKLAAEGDVIYQTNIASIAEMDLENDRAKIRGLLKMPGLEFNEEGNFLAVLRMRDTDLSEVDHYDEIPLSEVSTGEQMIALATAVARAGRAPIVRIRNVSELDEAHLEELIRIASKSDATWFLERVESGLSGLEIVFEGAPAEVAEANDPKQGELL